MTSNAHERVVMKPIFLDNTLQEQFDRDGFVVLDDVISTARILKTRAYLSTLSEAEHGPLAHTAGSFTYITDPSYKSVAHVADLRVRQRMILQLKESLFDGVLDRVLSAQYRPAYIEGMTNHCGRARRRRSHERFSWHNHIVRAPHELPYPGLTLHIPLQRALHNKDGPMAVARGSHRPNIGMRYPNVMGTVGLPQPLSGVLNSLACKCYTDLGQAILFHSSLYHSATSFTDESYVRMFAFADFVPSGTKMEAYYWKDHPAGWHVSDATSNPVAAFAVGIDESSLLETGVRRALEPVYQYTAPDLSAFQRVAAVSNREVAEPWFRLLRRSRRGKGSR